MALYCRTEVFRALHGLKFPATRSEVLSYAAGRDISEGALVLLNHLEEGRVYNAISDVCENAASKCSLDMERALKGLSLPVTKSQVLSCVAGCPTTEAVLRALRELPEHTSFTSVADICAAVL